MADPTYSLLSQLENIDVEEDRILDELLRRGAAIDEAERRSRMVTVAELRALRSGLESLENAIDSLQAGVARAEAAADEGAKPKNGNGSPAAPPRYGISRPTPYQAPAAPAPAPQAEPAPPPLPTFEELAERIRGHDAESAQLRALLRDRFAAYEQAQVATPVPVPDPGGQGPVVTPVPPMRRTFSVTSPPMEGGDVQSFQSVLNHRLARWEVGLRVKPDGRYGPSTHLAARRVARAMGLSNADLAYGITRDVRVLINNPSRRTPAQVARAKAAAPYRRSLRGRYPLRHAHGRAHAHPARRAATRAKAGRAGTGTTSRSKAPVAPGGLEAAIRSHNGRYGYEDILVREARANGLPVSLVCAVMEMESDFRNVFGHDRVANPVKSPPGGLLEVTEQRYREYLRHRNRGEGHQGVGPMQLTYGPFQDRADKLGGCWKPDLNIKVGVAALAANIKAHGTHVGVRLYNGSTPAAEDYAVDVLKLEREWRDRLAGLSPGTGGGGGGGSTKPIPKGPHAPRVFKVTPKQMSGSDIKAFQDALNRRMERWGIDLRVEEDGVYGPATKLMARRVARALGIDPADYARGMTPAVRSVIRNPKRRTPAQIARARSNRPWKMALKKRHAVSGGGSGHKPGPSVKGDGSYPLTIRGKFNGGPYQGSHRKGNWQSDNAVDLNVPVGTPMLSIDDGVVVKLFRHPHDNSGFAGDQITIRGDHGNSYFYTHGYASVKAGDRVHRGQVIGTSGSAIVPHLHFAVKKGDPRQIIGQFK